MAAERGAHLVQIRVVQFLRVVELVVVDQVAEPLDSAPHAFDRRLPEAVRLVLLGGVVRRNYRSLVGSLAELALSQVSADLVLLTCTGVRANGHVVDNMAVEAPIKQAIQWIDDQLHDNPKADRVKLVDEASRRFDLSPADEDFLFRHLGSKPKT